MNYRILIVDDSSYMRNQIAQIVMGMDELDIVGVASCGEDAVDLALEKRPDLISLDNILPDMTGLDVIKAIRPDLPDVKVLMISAVGQQSAMKEAALLGVENYLVKPIHEEGVVKALRQLMK